MHRWLLSLLLTSVLLGTRTPKRVSADVQVIETSVDYLFGDHITFLATVKSDVPIEKAWLFFRPQGESDTLSGRLNVNSQGEAFYKHDLTNQSIRAFSTIIYWFELTMDDGKIYTSPEYSFDYEDNRYNWQSRESPPFRVHWYEGDIIFGQNMLDVAILGLNGIQSLLSLSSPKHVDIYAYANSKEMQASLQLSSHTWVGAHTDPDLGVMVVSLPAGPEQRLEMERQIPHELMHILLYEEIGPNYGKLPVWLNEGLASVNELYANPDYLTLLDNAQKNKTLYPISSLCTTFPRDASGAFLAYAQATSFTRYLHQQYGSSGLHDLLRQYADGLDCERGIQVALGSTLTQLEHQWRSEYFGENAFLTALYNLLPWLVLLVAALGVPLGLTIRGLRRL
ncbi:MAG TPA: hypothetical protein ENI27_06660 [bacterium]|nr:hypothetical protein [bacterium]